MGQTTSVEKNRQTTFWVRTFLQTNQDVVCPFPSAAPPDLLTFSRLFFTKDSSICGPHSANYQSGFLVQFWEAAQLEVVYFGCKVKLGSHLSTIRRIAKIPWNYFNEEQEFSSANYPLTNTTIKKIICY